jgi:hypothetical protein
MNRYMYFHRRHFRDQIINPCSLLFSGETTQIPTQPEITPVVSGETPTVPMEGETFKRTIVTRLYEKNFANL